MIPTDVGVVDLMIGFPSRDPRRHYENLRAMAKDTESQAMDFPAEYMFKEVPNRLDEDQDPIEVTVTAMDRHHIDIGLVGLRNPVTPEALDRYPDRFVAGLEIDPNDIGFRGPERPSSA